MVKIFVKHKENQECQDTLKSSWEYWWQPKPQSQIIKDRSFATFLLNPIALK